MLARLRVMRGWRLASLVRIAADPGTRDLAAFGSCRRRERVDGTPCPWAARECHGGIVFVRKAAENIILYYYQTSVIESW